MKRLDRYIIRELWIPTLTGTLIVAFLFAINELIALYKTYEVSHVPAITWFQITLLAMPFWLTLTFPTGVALGSSLAVSRLTRESELTALRSAGMPIRRCLVPIIFVGILASLATFWIGEKVVPQSRMQHDKLLVQAAMLGATPRLQANVPLKLKDATVVFGSMTQADNNAILVTDITLIETMANHQVTIYSSPRGTYSDGVWRFQRGFLYNLQGGILTSGVGQDMVINQKIDIGGLFQTVKPEEQTVSSLLLQIKEGRQSGQNVRGLEVSLWSRFTIPLACVIFALMSAVLSIRLARIGPFTGVLVSFTSCALYYNTYVISNDVIGRLGWLPPMLAASAPNILFLAITVVVAWRLE